MVGPLGLFILEYMMAWRENKNSPEDEEDYHRINRINQPCTMDCLPKY